MAASEVFRLFGTIGVRTDEADRALKKTADQGKKTADELSFGEKVNRSLKKAESGSKILMGTVAGVGLAGVAAITKFGVMGGFSRALNIEDAQAKLRGLGHSGETVDAIMSNALASVKGTAFGLDAAATTAANAVAAGIQPGTQLEGVLTTVANAAALAGTDMDEMGAIFNKVATSNKVQMDVINQLHDRGIPALQFLADEMGVTAEQASEMASRGEIDFATFERAMKEGVGNAALEMGNTTRGAWANMQAAMARVGASIAEKILPKLKDVIGDITAWIDENADKIVETLESMVQGIIDGFKWLDELVGMDNVLWAIGGAILMGMVPALVALAKGLWATWAPLLPWMAAGAALALVIKGIIWVVQNWGEIMDWFGGIWESITDAIGAGLNWLSELWTTTWNGITDFFKTVWDGILLVLQAAWQGILDFLTIAIGIPLAIINTILIQPLLALWNWIWDLLKSTFETVWNGIVEFFTPIIEGISNTISTVIDGIKAVWDKVWGSIRDFFKKVWDAMVLTYSPIIEKIKDTIAKVIEGIKSTWDSIWNGIKSTFTSVWNAIKSFLTPIINGIKNTISRVFNGIKNTVTTVWNGIRDAIQKPIDKAKDIVGKAIDAIKKFFSFKIKWPKIPMPRFSIQPSGWKIADLLKGSIPKLGIDFFAKGGILRSPTIFGMSGDNMMVGGEAGNEAVLPLNRDTLGMIGDGIASTMNDSSDTEILEALLAEIKQLREDQKDLKVIMDSGELVGAIQKKIDKALEGVAALRRRGVTP